MVGALSDTSQRTFTAARWVPSAIADLVAGQDQGHVDAAKVPPDPWVTTWAEHPAWESGRGDLELSHDENPRIEVRLKIPESRLGSVVAAAAGRSIADARVTV